MLSRKPTDVEQPRLEGLEARWIKGQRLRRPRDQVLGLARFDQRSIERRERLGEQRMVRGSALDAPRRLTEKRERALASAEKLVESGQRFARLEPCLHRRPLSGKPGFLAFLGCKRLDFSACMSEPFALALGGRMLRPSLHELGLGPHDFGPRASTSTCRASRSCRAAPGAPWD